MRVGEEQRYRVLNRRGERGRLLLKSPVDAEARPEETKTEEEEDGFGEHVECGHVGEGYGREGREWLRC